MNRVRAYLLSRRMLGNVVVLGLLGLWFVLLGPTAFGGPAGYIEVSGHSMDGTYKTGDLILTRAKDSYQVGDIITFKVNDGAGQVIHRIIGGNGTKGYTTQGDNNPDPDPWHPTDADVVGQAWHRFEGKAWMLHLPQRPWFVGLSAGLLTLVVLGLDSKPSRKDASPGEKPPAGTSPVPSDIDEDLVVRDEQSLVVPAQRVGSAPAASGSGSGPRYVTYTELSEVIFDVPAEPRDGKR